MPVNDDIFLGDSGQSIHSFQNLLQETGIILENDFLARKAAFSGKTPQELKEILKHDVFLPAKGLGSLNTLRLTGQWILPHLVNVASTDYMAHLHCASLTDSVIAELLLSVYNQSMDSWDQAPMATELELHVLREMAALAGLPTGTDGVFTSGGSQSNLMGVVLAREDYCTRVLNHDIRKQGLPPQFSQFRIYTSEVAHFSIEKSAQLLGLGFRTVRPVPADKQKKMSIEHLRIMIAEDLAQGNIPIAVSATAGTTDFGSIDPLDEIRKICDEYKIWMHTDAAYGGGLIISDTYKNRLKGMELSDSVTIDLHKMFMQPVSCSVFFLKDPSLFKLLEIHADYLNREEEEDEGYTHLVGRSLATTRRFDALKVWMSFKSLGKDVLSKYIESTLETALAVYEYLTEAKCFEAVTRPELSSLVFRYLTAMSEEKNEFINITIRKKLIHEKGIVIGQTRINGKTFLKMTMLNPKISFDSIKKLLTEIEVMAAELII
ncbi:MAG: aspartate aminotransferase family protein [Spirochaetales bacterium]|nr:aspartate aminotransferase family protein [Spirochaetales bacterium]